MYVYFRCYFYAASNQPTYGDLIDLFEEVEAESYNDEHLLCSKFQRLYPSISIGRPRRFFETVERIMAPVRPSTRGDAALKGSPLSTYRNRVWMSRVRYSTLRGIIESMHSFIYAYTLCILL